MEGFETLSTWQETLSTHLELPMGKVVGGDYKVEAQDTCLQVLLLLWHSVGPNVGVADLRGNENKLFQEPTHYPPTTDLK